MSDGYQVRPFVAEDYAAIQKLIGGPIPSWADLHHWRAYERSGLALTATYEGRLLGSAGFIERHPGRAEAWMMLTPEARRDHGMALARMVRRQFRELAGRYRRLEAEVSAEWQEAQDFAAWLGFRYEATMPQAGPNGETLLKVVIFPSSSAIKGAPE